MREWFLKGGPVMWPLLGASVVGLTFILERLLFWGRLALRRDEAGVEQVLRTVREGRAAEALGIARTLRDPRGAVLAAGLDAPEGGHARAMEAAGHDLVARLKRSMGVIDTVITVAPLLGILGTVTGIINAFHLLGAGLSEDRAGVTAGLAEALITTVAGLAIAIPCICFYNVFLSLVDRWTRRLEDAGSRLELVFHERESPRVELGR